MMRTVETHRPILLSRPADSWAGTYTLDDFPIDPEAPYHDLARLDLGANGDFQLRGKLNGQSVSSSGRWGIEGAHLKLRDGQREFDYDLTGLDPSDTWHGAHMASQEKADSKVVRSFPVTMHQVPEPQYFQGPLRAEETPYVGEMQLDSDRFGEVTVELKADRTGRVEGTLDGQPVDADVHWMSHAPMTYLRIDGTGDFIAIHADHGPGHGGHAGNATPTPHGEVDVNVCREAHMGEYNMEMHFTPSHPH